jgi:LacI family transcriptional regulator
MTEPPSDVTPTQRLPRPRVPSVAIFIETATSWGRRLVQGILSYSQEHGPWHIHIEPHGPDDPFHFPSQWQGDGIIARISTRAMAEKLRATNLPVVNCSSIRIPGVDYPRVRTNLENSARMAVDLFRSRGFRHFAYVGNPAKDYVQNMFHAFEAALAEQGQTASFSRPSDDENELVAWLRALPKPVAVFCWGPAIGRLVIDACLEKDIAVPDDVAVLGADFDDVLSEASYPPQSGLRVASEQIGMTAAAILDAQMQGRPVEKKDWVMEPQGYIEKRSTDTLAVGDRRMAAVMRYIQDHFREPISVEDVLRANPMARRSLERKFRQLFGCSIVEQVRRMRVNEARLLLSGTDEPITLVAEKCGFTSYNYMGRVFQAATGMTARDYRIQSRRPRVEGHRIGEWDAPWSNAERA